MPFHKTLNILYFNAFAAQSLNDVLPNFDIWMSDEESTATTGRSVLVVREGWCGSA